MGIGPGRACQGVDQPYNGSLIAFRQQRNALKSLPQTHTLWIARYLFKLRCLARLRLDAQQFIRSDVQGACQGKAGQTESLSERKS